MQLNLVHNSIHRLTSYGFKTTVLNIRRHPLLRDIHCLNTYHNLIARNTFMTSNGSRKRVVMWTIFRDKCFLRQKSCNNTTINRRLTSISSPIRQQLNDGSKSSSTGGADEPTGGVNYSSGSDTTSGELTSDDEDLFHEPPKVRFGLLKVALTIMAGTYAGAMFAMFGANVLEEFEIFVKGDDEDDD